MNKKLVHTASRIAGAWRDFWTLVPDQQQQQQAEGQGGTSFSTPPINLEPALFKQSQQLEKR